MISLPLPRPFHVTRTLSFLKNSSLRTPYHFLDARRVRRLVHLDGRPAVVEFGFPAAAGATLRVAVARAPADKRRRRGDEDPAMAPELRRLATTVWSLGDDLRRCYRIFKSDPVMAPLLGHCRGLRMIRTPDPYEALLIAVVNQQVSVASAESIRRRMNAALGERIASDGITYITYPSPRRLLAMRPTALRALGLSRQKARYVLEIAARAAAGALDPVLFEGLDDEAVIAKLMEIPGVGRWTAEIVLMRGLGRADVFPAGDLGLAVAVQRVLGRRTRPTEDEMRALAARWMGWRSYGALYLWRSLGITA
jgi:DNA-3-methyladenine glycosylase II